MYLLLIGVHAIFFFIGYLLSSILLEGIFILFLIFFLLYFSPVFFTKWKPVEKTDQKILDINISPKKSIIIPLILTYLGIYILAFTVTRDIWQNFNLHLYILLFIFLIFAGYIFTFDWNTVFFRDAFRFHLICSYITILAQLVYFFIFSGEITAIHIIFSMITLGFSTFFFTYFQDENVNIFLAFVLSLLITIDTGIVFVFWHLHIFTLFWYTALVSMVLFEYIPRVPLFFKFIEPTRILLLTLLLGFAVTFMISPLISYFSFVWFLPVIIAFLFSIHIRYSNYISYSIAIITLFFLYSYLFLPLLTLPDLISSLLFIFFFPLCIIGNTYFWEERYPYDFSLLHYSSIGFSVIAGLYSLIFIAWWAQMSLFLACSMFLLAILFLLSYFRFQTR